MVVDPVVAQLKEMLTTHAWVPHDLHFLTVDMSVTTVCNIVNAKGLILGVNHKICKIEPIYIYREELEWG